MGIVAGIFAGLFGTGGPPLIFYYQLKGTPKTLFRTILITLFFERLIIELA